MNKIIIGIILVMAVLAVAGCSKEVPKVNSVSEVAGDNAAAPSTVSAGASAPVNVAMAGTSFNPEAVTVQAGTEVTWTKETAGNRSLVCADLVNSGKELFGDGNEFSYTFTTPGTYECMDRVSGAVMTVDVK